MTYHLPPNCGRVIFLESSPKVGVLVVSVQCSGLSPPSQLRSVHFSRTLSQGRCPGRVSTMPLGKPLFFSAVHTRSRLRNPHPHILVLVEVSLNLRTELTRTCASYCLRAYQRSDRLRKRLRQSKLGTRRGPLAADVGANRLLLRQRGTRPPDVTPQPQGPGSRRWRKGSNEDTGSGQSLRRGPGERGRQPN